MEHLFALAGAIPDHSTSSADGILYKLTGGICASLLPEHPGTDCGVLIAAHLLDQFGYLIAGLFILFAVFVSVVDR